MSVWFGGMWFGRVRLTGRSRYRRHRHHAASAYSRGSSEKILVGFVKDIWVIGSYMAYRLLGHHAVGRECLWADRLVALDAGSIRGSVGSGLLGGEPGDETAGKHLDCWLEIGDAVRRGSGSGEVERSKEEVSPGVYSVGFGKTHVFCITST